MSSSSSSDGDDDAERLCHGGEELACSGSGSVSGTGVVQQECAALRPDQIPLFPVQQKQQQLQGAAMILPTPPLLAALQHPQQGSYQAARSLPGLRPPPLLLPKVGAFPAASLGNDLMGTGSVTLSPLTSDLGAGGWAGLSPSSSELAAAAAVAEGWGPSLALLATLQQDALAAAPGAGVGEGAAIIGGGSSGGNGGWFPPRQPKQPKPPPLRVLEPTVFEKGCSICNLVKPADEFCRDSHKKSGLGPHCKACEVEYRRQCKLRRQQQSQQQRPQQPLLSLLMDSPGEPKEGGRGRGASVREAEDDGSGGGYFGEGSLLEQAWGGPSPDGGSAGLRRRRGAASASQQHREEGFGGTPDSLGGGSGLCLDLDCDDELLALVACGEGLPSPATMVELAYGRGGVSPPSMAAAWPEFEVAAQTAGGVPGGWPDGEQERLRKRRRIPDVSVAGKSSGVDGAAAAGPSGIGLLDLLAKQPHSTAVTGARQEDGTEMAGMLLSRAGDGHEEVSSLTIAGLGLLQRSSASTQRLPRRGSPGFPLHEEDGLLQGEELEGEVLHDGGDSSEDSGHFGLVAACAAVERAGEDNNGRGGVGGGGGGGYRSLLSESPPDAAAIAAADEASAAAAAGAVAAAIDVSATAAPAAAIAAALARHHPHGLFGVPPLVDPTVQQLPLQPMLLRPLHHHHHHHHRLPSPPHEEDAARVEHWRDYAVVTEQGYGAAPSHALDSFEGAHLQPSRNVGSDFLLPGHSFRRRPTGPSSDAGPTTTPYQLQGHPHYLEGAGGQFEDLGGGAASGQGREGPHHHQQLPMQHPHHFHDYYNHQQHQPQLQQQQHFAFNTAHWPSSESNDEFADFLGKLLSPSPHEEEAPRSNVPSAAAAEGGIPRHDGPGMSVGGVSPLLSPAGMMAGGFFRVPSAGLLPIPSPDLLRRPSSAGGLEFLLLDPHQHRF